MDIHTSHTIGGPYGNSCERCGCGSQTLSAERPCVPKMAEGTKVHCIHASIDREIGKSATGEITGFARFSSYHAREAMVKLDSGESAWFWCSSLEELK